MLAVATQRAVPVKPSEIKSSFGSVSSFELSVGFPVISSFGIRRRGGGGGGGRGWARPGPLCEPTLLLIGKRADWVEQDHLLLCTAPRLQRVRSQALVHPRDLWTPGGCVGGAVGSVGRPIFVFWPAEFGVHTRPRISGGRSRCR